MINSLTRERLCWMGVSALGASNPMGLINSLIQIIPNVEAADPDGPTPHPAIVLIFNQLAQLLGHALIYPEPVTLNVTPLAALEALKTAIMDDWQARAIDEGALVRRYAGVVGNAAAALGVTDDMSEFSRALAYCEANKEM